MIAIKDMDMPKTCTMCWLSPMCKVHGEKPEYLGYDTRMEGCPLVEIVTCVDCKHHKDEEDGDIICTFWDFCGCEHSVLGNGYCDRAERKEHETD